MTPEELDAFDVFIKGASNSITDYARNFRKLCGDPSKEKEFDVNANAIVRKFCNFNVHNARHWMLSKYMQDTEPDAMRPSFFCKCFVEAYDILSQGRQ